VREITFTSTIPALECIWSITRAIATKKPMVKTKQPYRFEVKEGELFAYAGRGERWKDASGSTTQTCSILTTTPNAQTAPNELIQSQSRLGAGVRLAADARSLEKPCLAAQNAILCRRQRHGRSP
jgi:hypothetical protein